MNFKQIGIYLCYGAIGLCAILHLATFLGLASPLLLLVPFALLGGAIVCMRAADGWSVTVYRFNDFSQYLRPLARIGFVVMGYAVVLMVIFYKATNGATGVGIEHGEYVYLHKDTVIRAISEQEYYMYPAWIMRVFSAHMTAGGFFCLSWLKRPVGNDVNDGCEDARVE